MPALWLADSAWLAGAVGEGGQVIAGMIAVTLAAVGAGALVLTIVGLIWDLIGWARGRVDTEHG
jgi:hypothetical protein